VYFGFFIQSSVLIFSPAQVSAVL